MSDGWKSGVSGVGVGVGVYLRLCCVKSKERRDEAGGRMGDLYALQTASRTLLRPCNRLSGGSDHTVSKFEL